jgi:hypothetical protein
MVVIVFIAIAPLSKTIAGLFYYPHAKPSRTSWRGTYRNSPKLNLRKRKGKQYSLLHKYVVVGSQDLLLDLRALLVDGGHLLDGDTVPTLLFDILVQYLRRVRTQKEPALDVRQGLKEPLEISFGVSPVVTHTRIEVRRIAVEEGNLRIARTDDLQRIGTL